MLAVPRRSVEICELSSQALNKRSGTRGPSQTRMEHGISLHPGAVSAMSSNGSALS